MEKKAITELADAIMKNPEMELHSFVINPPLPAAKLAKLSDQFSLPENLLKFYREMNGFQLSYTYRSNTSFLKEKFGHYDRGFPHMWPNENYWQLDGCINILPLDFMLLNDWKDYIWFENVTDTTIEYKGKTLSRTAFEKKLRPFDLFSKSSIAVVHFDKNNCDVLLSTDHNASYTDYKPLSLEAYINGVIKIKGIIDARPGLFGVKA